MANSTTANTKNNNPVNTRLIGVLGVLIVIAILVAMVNKKQSSDPTLTAAPPIVATPGHPIVLHTKSPEAMARQMGGSEMPTQAGASAQPAMKP